MYFLETERLGLRALTEADATPVYQQWLHDPQVTIGLESGAFPSSVESLGEFIRQMNASPSNVLLGMFDKTTHTHIGNIKLGNIHWIHRHAELGIMIGDRNAWGKGFGQDACSLLLDYAFSRLNLHKVWLTVFANNTGAIRLYEKLGFHHEGRQINQIFVHGAYTDKLYMGIFNPTHA